MDLDFIPDNNSLFIPQNVYRPIKRCAFCYSVYITDTKCESCGKVIDFNFIGEPLGNKSFFSLKERYSKI